MLSSAVVMVALSQASGYALILALTALAGLCAEAYRPASSALLADLVPAGRRLTAFAAYRLAVNLGFAAGPAVAGLLAERAFVLVFAGDALTSAVFGVMALTMLPRSTRERHAPAAGEAETQSLVRAVLADPPFLLFLGASFAGAMVYFQQEAALPLQVVADGHSTAIFGTLMSINGLVVTLVELPSSAVTRKFPARRVIALGLLVTGIGFGATGLVASTAALAATVVVWTLGEIATAPVSAAYVADISPPHMRGRYAGVFGMTFGLALVVGPAAGTALYAARPGAVWSACVVLGALAAALMLLPAARPKAYATTASRSTSVA